MLVALMVGALFLTGMIYDTRDKTTVDAFFFQPNNLFYQRPGELRPVNDLSPDQLRDMLLNKYITEFFYVTPDTADLANRLAGRNALPTLSSPQVFAYWQNNVAPEIEEMTNKRMLRTASLVSVTPVPGSDRYWRVEYELKTWEKPNNLALSPKITRGAMNMEIIYRQKLKDKLNGQPIVYHLESGKDPVAVFGFGIQDITIQEE